MKKILLILFIPLLLLGGEFLDEQLGYTRAKNAYNEKHDSLKAIFNNKDLSFPPEKIFLRIFKDEDIIELWSREQGEYSHVKDYAICARSGKPGPKRKEGDLQVPEGYYFISQTNPWSNFHLSLKLDYPNKSDRILGHKTRPGGLIYIHGSCVTIGCIPIEDDQIKELYTLVILMMDKKSSIPVHIFPSRMTPAKLAPLENKYPKNIEFWQNMTKLYEYFEENNSVPDRIIDTNGEYIIE